MSFSSAIDTVLDRTVALGYGNLGLELRRRLPGWPAELPRMDGRTVLVTGAASGIGLASCRGFARLGARVWALARSQPRADDALRAIQAEVQDADVRAAMCDVSDLHELASFAERFGAEESRLDVLVNNAGTMPAERERTADGHELMFATHVLAPFVLISQLRGLLERSAPARVINVGSGGMYGQHLPSGDLESDHDSYGPKKLYARTKREQLVITEQWADQLRGTGVVVHAMHPGWVDTKGLQESLPLFRRITRPIVRSPEQGADTIVWLGAAAEPLESTGKFWHDRRERPTHYLLGASEDGESQKQQLWDFCQAAATTVGV